MFSGFMPSFLLYQLPTILFNLVGIVCGIAFYKRSPTAAWLVIIGMLVSLGGRIFASIMFAWMIDKPELREAMQWIGLVSTFCSCIAYVLMIVAIFVERGKPQSSQPL